MTNIDLEQRVQDLELRLAIAESMVDLLVNESRKQRGLEPVDWEQMRTDAKAAVDATIATVLDALGVEHPAAPSLTEQLREAQGTIDRVRTLASGHASTNWRATPSLSTEYAEGMNQAGDEIIALLDSRL
ncbi:hypothetical protein [Prescottella equi]|uniref:hypothetical protein n=1 Tax=Rhodococcus hoagii TaxID=43767 RepID=UPI000A10F21F|nr:hypothetical protein [Prescottella equi]ORL83917.1 hypothetical protein A5N71_01360 [Prescottella equi]